VFYAEKLNHFYISVRCWIKTGSIGMTKNLKKQEVLTQRYVL